MFFIKNRSHESFDRKEKLVVGSDRKFGFTFAALFFLMSISSLLIPRPVRAVLVILCVVFLACSLLEPQRLHPVNVLWMRFGQLLSKIVSPFILAVLFYLVFLPVGFLLKLFKKDILKLEIDKRQSSYWVDTSEAILTSMKDQF